MSANVRVGIIGCGVIRATHIESYQDLPGVEVVWACDIKADRAARRVEQYAIAHQTTDYREVLADPNVDAVSICTDHASHAELVVAAFEAGKHVICEKSHITFYRPANF